MTEPYTVVVENLGCPHCNRGRTWTVLGPDGVAGSTSYEDVADAHSEAAMKNAAYHKGQEAALPSAEYALQINRRQGERQT